MAGSGVWFKQNRILIVLLLGFVCLVVLYYSVQGPSRSTANPCLHSNQNAIRVSELIAASIDLSHRGGDEVRAVRRSRSNIGQEVKGKSSVNTSDYVTQGDKRSHEAIVAGLRARWPDLKYISEEHVQVDSSFVACPSTDNPEVEKSAANDPLVPMEDVLVWIDPLDATQEYTEGGENPKLLEYVTVMMCVCVQGEPVAGIIHQAFEGDTGNGVTYWGWKDHGFSKNIWPQVDAAKTKSKNKETEKEKVAVIVSRSHAGKATEEVCACLSVCMCVCVRACTHPSVWQHRDAHFTLLAYF